MEELDVDDFEGLLRPDEFFVADVGVSKGYPGDEELSEYPFGELWDCVMGDAELEVVEEIFSNLDVSVDIIDECVGFEGPLVDSGIDIEPSEEYLNEEEDSGYSVGVDRDCVVVDIHIVVFEECAGFDCDTLEVYSKTDVEVS